MPSAIQQRTEDESAVDNLARSMMPRSWDVKILENTVLNEAHFERVTQCDYQKLKTTFNPSSS